MVPKGGGGKKKEKRSGTNNLRQKQGPPSTTFLLKGTKNRGVEGGRESAHAAIAFFTCQKNRAEGWEKWVNDLSLKGNQVT